MSAYPDETFAGVLTQMRVDAVAEQTTTATSTLGSSAVTNQLATVVGYPAIVDVANPDERLQRGMTAEVTLVQAERPQAIRVPNSALSFHLAPEMLKTVHEADPGPPSAHGADPEDSWRRVWTFDGTRFTPLEVHVGLSDDRWTEVLSGPVQPGDELVTRATVARRSRI